MAKDNIQKFNLLFDDYYAPLCVFANSYIKDEDLANDIVQDIFIALWNKNEELDQIQSVKSYLYVSVRNACLNHLKHQAVASKFTQAELSEKESDEFFYDHIIEEETHRLFYQAIQKLPEKCRKIILMSLD